MTVYTKILTRSEKYAPNLVAQDNRNFQRIDPNLVSANSGTKDKLHVKLGLINTGNTPITFQPNKWMMFPSYQNAQRIALFSHRNLAPVFKYLDKAMAPDKKKLLEDAKEKLVNDGLPAIARFLAYRNLKEIYGDASARMFAMRFLSPQAAHTLLGMAPILGNALAAYEFVSGNNWITGKPLNVYERIASGFGAVPVSGIATGLFKASTPQFMQHVFTAAGLGTNFHVAPGEVARFANQMQQPMANLNAWTKQQANTMLDSISYAMDSGNYSTDVVNNFKGNYQNIKNMLSN